MGTYMVDIIYTAIWDFPQAPFLLVMKEEKNRNEGTVPSTGL